MEAERNGGNGVGGRGRYLKDKLRRFSLGKEIKMAMLPFPLCPSQFKSISLSTTRSISNLFLRRLVLLLCMHTVWCGVVLDCAGLRAVCLPRSGRSFPFFDYLVFFYASPCLVVC